MNKRKRSKRKQRVPAAPHRARDATSLTGHENAARQRIAADLVSVVCLDPDPYATKYPCRADIRTWFGVEAVETFNGAGDHELLYRVKP